MKKRKRFWFQENERTSSIMQRVLLHLFMLLPLIWSLVATRSDSLLLANPSQCFNQNLACNCSWKSGKFVADCNSQFLKKVPNNDYYDNLMLNSGNNQMPTLARDIQSLNLSNNLISELGDAELSEKKFRNLQRLYLTSNKLSQIHPNAFFKLTGLVELDLSSNELINLGSFQGNWSSAASFMRQLASLRHLNLASNKIQRLTSRAFSNLRQLRQLILSSNQIAFIHPNAFQDLKQLNVLHLDDNKLASLNGNLMMQVPQLYSIKLGGALNKWQCDCHLRPLIRQLVNFRTRSSAATMMMVAANASLAGSLTILEDEPHCWTGQQPEESNTNNNTLNNQLLSNTNRTITSSAELQLALSSPAWTNMTLAQFQCHPRLELQWYQQPSKDNAISSPPAPSERATQFMNINQSLATQRPKTLSSDDVDKDKQDMTLSLGDTDLVSGRRARRQSRDSPLELTCVLELADELDLEQGRIEWFVAASKATSGFETRQNYHWRLIVNYSQPGARARSPALNDQVTLIDYVTSRAAAKTKQQQNDVEESDKNDGDNDDINDKFETKSRFVRVVHLLLEPSSLLAAADNNYNRFASRHIATKKAAANLNANEKGTASSKVDSKASKLKRETTDEEQNDNELPVALSFLCRVTNAGGQTAFRETISLDGGDQKAEIDATNWLQSSKIDQSREGDSEGDTSVSSSNNTAGGNSIPPFIPLDDDDNFGGHSAPPRVITKYLEQINDDSRESGLTSANSSSAKNNNIGNYFPNLAPNSNALERAKLALSRELMLELSMANNNETTTTTTDNISASRRLEPIFIPIEMPSWILEPAAYSLPSGRQPEEPSPVVATEQQQQRPTVRQTNGTIATPFQLQPEASVMQSALKPTALVDRVQLERQRRLQPFAWVLIRDHTSNNIKHQPEQSDLLELDQAEHLFGVDQFQQHHDKQHQLSSSASGQGKFYNRNNLSGRLSKQNGKLFSGAQKEHNQSIWPFMGDSTINSVWFGLKRFYKQNLDRYAQFAIGHVFVLLWISSSILIVASFLSVAIVLMSRKRRQQRERNQRGQSSQSPTKMSGHANSGDEKKPNSPKKKKGRDQKSPKSKLSINNVRHSPDVISCVSAASERLRSSSVSTISDLMIQGANSLRPKPIIGQQHHTRTPSMSLQPIDEFQHPEQQQQQQQYFNNTTATNTCESSSSATYDSDRRLIKPSKSYNNNFYSQQQQQNYCNFEDNYEKNYEIVDRCEQKQQRWATTLQRPSAIIKKETMQSSSTLARSSLKKTVNYRQFPEHINIVDITSGRLAKQQQEHHDGHIDYQVNAIDSSPSPFYQMLTSDPQQRTSNDNHNMSLDESNSSITGNGSHLILVEPPESKYFATLMHQKQQEHHQGSLNRHYRVQPISELDATTMMMMMQSNQAMNYGGLNMHPRSVISNVNENIPHSASITSPAASSNTSAAISDTQHQQQQQFDGSRMNISNYGLINNPQIDHNNLTPQNSIYIDGALHFLHTSMNECLPQDQRAFKG